MWRGIFLIILLLFFSADLALAYSDETTHPKLTKAIIKHWNDNHDRKITIEEENWIIKGSIKEDWPASRSLNHFYNPLNNEGLSLADNFIIGIPAPLWATSPLLQRLDLIGGNYSWPSALYNYEKKEYKKSFLALGHILHLLEDMAVPAHVRNDQHLEGDPYENWAKENDNKIIVNNSLLFKPTCQDLLTCFKELALVCNYNFLSQDSLSTDKFSLGLNKIDIDEENYVRANGHLIAFYNHDKKRFELNNKIHESYWKDLSGLVVDFGSRALELFFNNKHQDEKNISEEDDLRSTQIDVDDNILEDNDFINNNKDLKEDYEEAKKIVKEFTEDKTQIPFKSELKKIDENILNDDKKTDEVIENYIPEDIELREETVKIINDIDKLETAGGKLIENIQNIYTQVKENFINNVSASTIESLPVINQPTSSDEIINNDQVIPDIVLTSTPTTTIIIVPTSTPTTTEEDNNEEEDEEGEDFDLITQPLYLWHFNDCRGQEAVDSINGEKISLGINLYNKWVLGKFNCAFEQSFREGSNLITKHFNNPQSLDEMTLAYYCKDAGDSSTYSRVRLLLSGNGKNSGINIAHYDNTKVFYNNAMVDFGKALISADKNWHQILVVYSNDYLAFYLDGELTKKIIGDFSLSHELADLEIAQENGATQFDELAFWNRALSSEEIENNYQLNNEIEPKEVPSQPEIPEKIYYWNFNENFSEAIDNINNFSLGNITRISGNSGGGIYMNWQPQYTIIKNLSKKLNNKDLSIGVFVKNISYPNEGRGIISLRDNLGSDIFGLRHSIGYQRTGFYHNSFFKSAGDIIPNDLQWHYLVTTYDSYRYLLSFYVDGELKYNKPDVFLDGEITSIVIQCENFPYHLDELSIWQGALSSTEVKDIYDNF